MFEEEKDDNKADLLEFNDSDILDKRTDGANDGVSVFLLRILSFLSEVEVEGKEVGG